MQSHFSHSFVFANVGIFPIKRKLFQIKVVIRKRNFIEIMLFALRYEFFAILPLVRWDFFTA